jgi:hypothetical protein
MHRLSGLAAKQTPCGRQKVLALALHVVEAIREELHAAGARAWVLQDCRSPA